jgi:hypothetical protein
MRNIFSKRSISVSSRKAEQNYMESSIGIITERRPKVKKVVLIEVANLSVVKR